MGRHQRRSEIVRFKHEVSDSDLTTYLIDAFDSASINRVPLLRDAVRYWCSNIEKRRPTCIACKVSFAGGKATAGAFLLATPVNAPTACSVSALCSGCWAALPDAEVKAVALRVLRRVSPGFVFRDKLWC